MRQFVYTDYSYIGNAGAGNKTATSIRMVTSVVGRNFTCFYPNLFATSSQLMTLNQLATYSLRLFWYFR